MEGVRNELVFGNEWKSSRCRGRNQIVFIEVMDFHGRNKTITNDVKGIIYFYH
jgi:hypothetical protein